MRYRALIVLAVSGLLGFRVGMIAFPDWQVAVESAQVTAGIVKYPAATPFFVYHVELWTILHQVLAVGLRLGLSEAQLSLILSGTLGMVSFQALTMFVYAISRDEIVALAAPLFILATGTFDFGTGFPVMLLGVPHTYSVLGLSLFVLTVALLGAGCYRSGAFVLAITPAVHPSLGLGLWLVCGLAFIWNVREVWEDSRHAVGYLAVGCLITSVSYAVHLNSAYTGDAVDPAVAARYLSSFVTLWDAHRQPVTMAMDGVALNRGALALALIWLAAFSSDLPAASRFLLRAVAVAAVLSLITVMVSWIPPEKLPRAVLVLMPTRLGNFNAMTFVALLFGLIGAYRAKWWSRGLTLLLAVALALGGRSMFWRWQGRGAPIWTQWLDIWWVLGLASVALVAFVAASWRRGETRALPDSRLFYVPVALALVAALALPNRMREPGRSAVFGEVDGMVFREAARGSGLLITGGNLHLIQLRTRRPVLFDGGALDELPYAPDAGPETERIMRDIYGIDFFNPPDEARNTGMLPSRLNQELWEGFTLERWKAIRYSYQAEQVMTPSAWELKLPIAAQDRDLKLYQIPQ